VHNSDLAVLKVLHWQSTQANPIQLNSMLKCSLEFFIVIKIQVSACANDVPALDSLASEDGSFWYEVINANHCCNLLTHS
jgi:hypothetical protein